MAFDASKHTICRCIRDLFKEIIFECDDEFIERIKPKVYKIYFDAKKMNRKLNWYASAGELPNPDSPGWNEAFWEKQITGFERSVRSVKRCAAKV